MHEKYIKFSSLQPYPNSTDFSILHAYPFQDQKAKGRGYKMQILKNNFGLG